MTQTPFQVEGPGGAGGMVQSGVPQVRSKERQEFSEENREPESWAQGDHGDIW